MVSDRHRGVPGADHQSAPQTWNVHACDWLKDLGSGQYGYTCPDFTDVCVRARCPNVAGAHSMDFHGAYPTFQPTQEHTLSHLTVVRSATGGRRGVTGLETAIILIAFVLVASVFAFTVLSTGIFSAERGKETIHPGHRGARSSLELKGSIVAEGVTNKTLSLADSAWTDFASLPRRWTRETRKRALPART